MNVSDTISALSREMLAAATAYRDAKREWAAAVGLVNSLPLSDPDYARAWEARDRALVTASWHRDDAGTLAAVVTALCLSQMGESR